MQDTVEKLEEILASIGQQNNILNDEYGKICADIQKLRDSGRDTTYLVQQLKDNMSSRKELYDRIRQSYKDSIGLSK